MQETQIDNALIETVFKTTKTSFPTLMKAKKPVVLVKFEFEKRENKNFTMLFLNFSRYYGSDAKEKKTISFLNTLKQKVCFWLRFFWKKQKT